MEKYDSNLWEFLKNCSLDASNCEITSDERVDLLQEILQVTLFIQNSGFSHGDLKPSNIFLKTEFEQNRTKRNFQGNIISNGTVRLMKGRWVLGDYGLSSRISELKGCCGTAGFASMEQFDGQRHLKSDNYSVAKLAIILLFKWNLGWALLAWPISKSEYQNAPSYQLLDYLSKMVQVSYS